MRIGPIQGINQMYHTQQKKPTPQAKSSIADDLRLSNEAIERNFAYNMVKSTPDIRTSKVDGLKSQVEQGNYNVSTEDLTQKLIDSFSM